MDNASLRRIVYGLLLAVTTGITTARIIGVEFLYDPSLYKAYPERKWPEAKPEPFPTFSSNDRSRWAAVRALVENGTFVIGQRVSDPTARDGARLVDGKTIKDPNARDGYYDEGIVFQDGYRTVDIVMNPETHLFYSTKPPLLTTLAAGEYWLLRETLGWTLTDPHLRWPIVCTILITFNVLPLIVFLCLLAKLLEEFGTTDWGRLFVFASACFGTFLTTFAVTFNNHTPAACCVMVAVYPLLRGRAGGGASFFTPRELLQAGFFAALAAGFDVTAAAFTAAAGFVVLLCSWRGWIWFVPAALVPVAAFLAVNYIEVGTFVPIQSKVGTEWYEYEGSHWKKAKINPNQKGIDFAREPKEVYAFHMLFGHHGLFSLTPIWLFALAGRFWRVRGPTPAARAFGVLTLLITAVVIAFYIITTNNYEGWTSGPRWAFWLTPLLLIALIPAADRLGVSRWGRCLAYVFLMASVFSAVYPVWNPWRHPWAYQLCEYMGWMKY
jgi:hypothetical protein